MSETATETTDETVTDDTESEETTDAAVEGEESLGDAGKKALDAMKEQRKAERTARRAAEKENADLKARLAKLEAGKGDDDAPDADAIRAEAEKAATAKANERIVRSEIKAAATGKLADPADAALYLNLSDFEVGDDGSIDEDEIADAIDALLKKKPHLAAAQGGSKGSGDGGARKGPKASQLSREDLKDMSPEAITKAKAEGRLNDLLGMT